VSALPSTPRPPGSNASRLPRRCRGSGILDCVQPCCRFPQASPAGDPPRRSRLIPPQQGCGHRPERQEPAAVQGAARGSSPPASEVGADAAAPYHLHPPSSAPPSPCPFGVPCVLLRPRTPAFHSPKPSPALRCKPDAFKISVPLASNQRFTNGWQSGGPPGNAGSRPLPTVQAQHDSLRTERSTRKPRLRRKSAPTQRRPTPSLTAPSSRIRRSRGLRLGCRGRGRGSCRSCRRCGRCWCSGTA
jgi:hypothetical protein